MSQTIEIEITPVITAGAYSDGDNLGPEQVLEGMGGLGGVLHTITVFDAAAQNTPMDLFFFSSNPAGTYTDNGVFALDASDTDKVIGVISIVAGDYKTITPDSIAILNNLGFTFGATPSFGPLYVVAVINGTTPTYLTISDLRFRYGVLPG